MNLPNPTNNPHKPIESSPAKRKRRPWLIYLFSGWIIVVVGFVTVALLQTNGTTSETTVEESINYAEVIVTDLIQEETFDGVIGSIQDDPIKTMLGGTITDLPEAGETIRQGEALFAINNEPVILLYGELPAYRDIAIGSEAQTISTSPNGTITWVADPGTLIQQGDELYRVDNQPVIALYGAQPAYRDLAIVASGPGAIDETITILNQLNGTFTWVAAPGTVIQQSDVLFRVDDQPVIALYGDQPAYRDLYNSTSYTPSEASLTAAQANVTFAARELTQAEAAYAPYRNKPDGNLNKAYYGAAWAAAQQAYDAAVRQLNALTGTAGGPLVGDDVYQLEQALVALGYDDDGNLEADDTFSFETTRAVRDFQVDLGLEQDGVLDLGEIVFVPGPTQVLDSIAAPGDPATTQGAVMTVTTRDATVGPDVQQLQEALIALGYDADGTLQADGTFTAETTQAVLEFQAATGQAADGVVDFGEIVFFQGPSQVIENWVLPGDPAGGEVMRITTGIAANSTDILQLETALLELGFDAEGTLEADGNYSLETYQAVLAFQTAAGLEPDGILDLGEIIFLPAAVRVTEQLTTKGSNVGPDTSILGISLSDKVVYMALPADDQDILSVGDDVKVEMPDNTLVPATVVFVSQTATTGPNEWDPAWFEVRIALEDPRMASELDEAPVDIIVVSDSVTEVMAIPVSALVALLEGGYAVEVDLGNGAVQLTAVDVGFFSSNNLIEITAGDLEPGDQVVVP
jgi:peptidoglycan hydrolase-like protein with peptidoglycan-binding domain